MTFQEARRIGSRLVMMVGGEAMQSGLTFALNIALLHMLPAKEYGVFALVMVVGGIGLTYVRSLTAMPASICIAQSHSARAAAVHEVTFGSGAVLLALATALAVWLMLDVWVATGAWAGAAFVGLWSVRSHLRIAFFARQRQAIVAASDLAFTLAAAAMAALVLSQGADILRNILIVLALANALGIGLLLVLAGRPVRISVRASMRRRFVKMWRPLGWSLVSITATTIQGQGVALLVAAMAGPAAYGPIAAALVMFVPLRVANGAIANMVQPDQSARLARGDYAQVWRASLGWTAFLGTIALVYGVAIAFVLPLIQAQALENMPIYKIGFLAWFVYTMPMLYVLPRVTLEAMAAFRAIALVTIIAALVGNALTFAVLMVAAPTWALLGGAVSEFVVLVASWVIFRRLWRALPGEGAARATFHSQMSGALRVRSAPKPAE